MVRRKEATTLAVTPQALWPFLSDTERLNRDLNLPPVKVQLLPGGLLHGEVRFGPLTIRYTEEPYCWVEGRHWQLRRLLENGPVRSYAVGIVLEPEGEGSTRLSAWCETEPRPGTGGVLARRIAKSSVDGLLRIAGIYASHIQGHTPTPHPRRSPVHWMGKTVSERLSAFLESAPEDEVALFRPYSLAERFSEPRRDVLHACLSAVRAGSLELSWRLLCPACRGTGEPGPRLNELVEGEAHCPSCDIRYRPAFDRDVEVCFSHAHRKSELGSALFCRGGPRRSAHVALQWFVPAGETRRVPVELPAGRYLLRSPHAKEVLPIVLQGQGGSVLSREGEVLTSDGLLPLGNTRAAVLATEGEWTFSSPPSGDTLFCLESLRWREDAATAAEVTALSEFRKHFGSEVLSPGVEVAVRQVGFLFTDLKGSTALYAEQGDAPSYATIRQHFTLLETLIEREGGGIIKTIGDAVMAVFPSLPQALSAALAIQREETQGLVIKCGIHAGPALAIEANKHLDYFGQTVNVAARIQSESEGGDVVLAEKFLTDTEIQCKLEGLSCTPFSTELKGVGAVRLVRVSVACSLAS
ncbi:MAG: adenylate/guanylate cyclase domain-containing protein [Armatimonas sp.]